MNNTSKDSSSLSPCTTVANACLQPPNSSATATVANALQQNADQNVIKNHDQDTNHQASDTIVNDNNEHQIGSSEEELLSTSKAFYVSLDDNPNMIVFKKLEKILDKMQDEKLGVPVRTVKTFMTKIPSVFTGQDLINWLMANMELGEAQEALCLANRMASFGYFFPIDDHVLTVKNDNAYYRFQVW